MKTGRNAPSQSGKVSPGFDYPVVLLAALLFLGCSSHRIKQKANGPTPASAGAGLGGISVERLVQAAVEQPCTRPPGAGWQALFDGKTLQGWKPTSFPGGGKTGCEQGLILMESGSPFTGITRVERIPTMDYEVTLEALRLSGSDFFCGLTVPVLNSSCSLIVGGWGGSLVGISSLDGRDASENETTRTMDFENGRWYRIRVRVTSARLEAWIDEQQVANVVTTNKRIAVRSGDIELSQPFGICCWQTFAACRNLQIRLVNIPSAPVPK